MTLTRWTRAALAALAIPTMVFRVSTPLADPSALFLRTARRGSRRWERLVCLSPRLVFCRGSDGGPKPTLVYVLPSAWPVLGQTAQGV